MDQTSWTAFEIEPGIEGPKQLELFPETYTIVEDKLSPRVFTAVKPRQTTGILRDCSEGTHPLRFDFSGMEKRWVYYAGSGGKSTAYQSIDFSEFRRVGDTLFRDIYSEPERGASTPRKKNIQPGPKPSINARKRW